MLPSLCIRVSLQYPARYGIALRFSDGQFDRPFVKCYKSMFCAGPCVPSPGRFAGHLWISGVVLGSARGGFFLVEREQFGPRSRQTALLRKSVPEATVPGSCFPVNELFTEDFECSLDRHMTTTIAE